MAVISTDKSGGISPADNIQVGDEIVMYIPYTYTGRTPGGLISGIVQAPIGILWDPAKETYAEAVNRQMPDIADAMAALRKATVLSMENDVENLI